MPYDTDILANLVPLPEPTEPQPVPGFKEDPEMEKLLKEGYPCSYADCGSDLCAEANKYLAAKNGNTAYETPYLVLSDNPFDYNGPPASTLRTQKARGLAVVGRGIFSKLEAGQGQAAPQCVKVQAFPHGARVHEYDLPLFARPCPTVPRHGFVESREVRTRDDVRRVIEETLAEDPNGEVIFMPKLTGKWSGILTHAGVAIGNKNDGATSGASVVNIPAYVPSGDFIRWVGSGSCERAGITQSPYLEFVEHDDKPLWVQLRDGPEVPQSHNYIPRKTAVKKVLFADPSLDLLAWEKLVKEASEHDTDDLVVWHPNGALTSHFSVHAITHQIPVILDAEEPKVGAVIEPTGWEPAPLTTADYRRIARYIAARFRKGYPSKSYHALAGVAWNAIGTLHASPQWDNSEHLLRLRAEGITGLLSLTAAACLGEMRHWYTAGPGRDCHDEEGEPTLDGTKPSCEIIRGIISEKNNRHRQFVYEKVLDCEPHLMHRWARQAARDLADPGWRGGFAGRGWAQAAKLTAKGFAKLETFLRTPNAKNWQKVMSAYNQIVNCAHNNGNILTKWISQRGMNGAAQCPGPCFVNNFTPVAALNQDGLVAASKKTTKTIRLVDRSHKVVKLKPNETAHSPGSLKKAA